MVLLFGFQGCASMSIGALSALYTATSAAAIGITAFEAYKVVQLSTGGEAEVRIPDENSVKNKDALYSLDSIAFYPTGGSEMVQLAAELSKRSSFHVITPAAVEKKLVEKQALSNIGGMTDKEQIDYLSEVCQIVEADAIFMLFISNAKGDTKIWSFDRPEMSFDFNLRLFPRDKEVIWDQKGKFVYKIGSKIPPDEEIKEIIVSALIERFIQDANQVRAQAQAQM